MKIYTSYLCTSKRCKKEFVLLTEDVQVTAEAGIYISCPYCNSKKIKKLNEYDSLKECMEDARIYIKVRGKWREIR